jgi:hypothetical protein
MTSVLLPNGPVFYSRDQGIDQIYNDGIPCLTIPSEKGIVEILHGISDEVFDDNIVFPMSATEAAELEATEKFVEMMATFDRLEALEEQARQDLGTARGTRWEARRRSGSSPTPHHHGDHGTAKLEALRQRVQQQQHYWFKYSHGHVKLPHQQTSIVPHHHHHSNRHFVRYPGAVVVGGSVGKDLRQSKPHRMPIQQPRKFN